MRIELSDLDEARFGIRTARTPHVTATDVAAALEFCRTNDVRMLIARCDADDYDAVHAIEDAGGRLMDVLVYYRRDLAGELPTVVDTLAVRPATAGDGAALESIASAAFVDYKGHYHADARLDRAAATAAYASWARRSAEEPGVADIVLAADVDGRLVGFSTIRLVDDSTGEVVLNAVDPDMQRRGIYRALLVRSMEWVRDQGRARFIISTHLSNIAVRRVWAQYGLEPYASFFTFHLWFD